MKENCYAIMRFAKYKGPEISRIEGHNERKKETYASNPDIDPARTHRNFHLLYPAQHYRAEAERQIKEAECRVRTDSTRLVEVLFTVSTGYFDDKTDDEIRAYYERSLDFLRAHQTDATILSAVVHMDEGTPHMHVVFVPLTPDHRLSAKDIIGNRKKLIQWQDQYYDYMAAKYPDLSRGESAAKTGRKHMSVKEFKAMTKDIKEMLNMADEIGKLLDGANLFNAQGRLGQLVPLFQKLLPRMGKMKTQLKQYGTAFTDTAAENEQLKKENARLSRENRQERDEAIEVRSELSRVQSDYRRLERKVANIPPEILTRYAPDIHLKDQSL